MNTIAPAIKRRRIQMGLTQREMSEKLHLSEKAWQNIENGITKMDLDRLNEIARILETPIMDLINAQETLYVHQLTTEQGAATAVNNGEVTINNDVSDNERKLFERVLGDKDAQIAALRKDYEALQEKYDALVSKIADKL